MEDTKKKEKKSSLPSHIKEKKSRVQIGLESVSHESTYMTQDLFSSYGEDNTFDPEKFKKNLKVNITLMNDEELVFDLIGIEAPIANAFRRIMISEIPTMAIEKVFIINNTGIMQDEVLSHRLGLIPIKVDPRKFEERKHKDPTDKDTIVFDLKVTCKRNLKATDDAPPSEKYINERVYSGDLVWKPQGDQEELFPEGIRPTEDKILITRLRPGQTIELSAYCEKGIGKMHSKWSPVATASYRLMPEISILEPIMNKEAENLVKLCPMKVFDIEDLSGGAKKAVVANPKKCTMCRECIRDNPSKNKIKLARVKDHFIYSVESVGILPSADIFKEAVKILISKCEALEAEIARISQGPT